ncbi:MAG: hypothetical protein GXZ11_09300 [Tissierellia bacterium]|nr:hypothetical protein [Tissierellia bacterium]
MGAQERAFREEPIGRLLVRLFIPIFLSYFASEIYSMVDSLVVSNFMGPVAVAGVNMVLPLQRLMVALAIMVSLGAQTHLSNFLGKHSLEEAAGIIKYGEKLVIIGFTPLLIVLYMVREPLFRMLGAGPEVAPLAMTYLSFLLPGMLAVGLSIYRSQLLIALGKSQVALISTVIGAFLNTGLDLLLVGKFQMGLAGAGLSTTISQIIACIYVMSVSKTTASDWKLNTVNPINTITTGQLLILGLSSFVIEAEDGLLIAIFNRLLASTVGDRGLIILGLNMRLYLLLFVALCAMAAAMQPLTSYYMGDGNYKKIIKVRNLTQKLATIVSLVLWAIFMLTTEFWLGLFVRDTELIAEAAKSFRIMIAGFPFISLYYVSIYYFQAIGKGRASFIVAIFRQLLVMVPLGIFMVKVMNLGALGVWLSYPISDVISGVASLWLLKREDGLMATPEVAVTRKESVSQLTNFS